MALHRRSGDGSSLSDGEIDRCIGKIRAHKVGGTYWAAQPAVPKTPYTLVRIADPTQRSAAAKAASGPVIVWPDDGDVDPWHLLGHANRIIVDSCDLLALIAAISELPVQCIGSGRFSSLASGATEALAECFRSVMSDGISYADPFSGAPLALSEAIELCGFWRRLVDSNRSISAAIGFGGWKQETAAPLLWAGSTEVRFETGRRAFAAGEGVVVWKAKTPAKVLERLEASGADIFEGEDGFIRSAGLGADCVPPLSLVVDRAGIYFDPRRTSDLEKMLQRGEFDPALLDRARALRALIVESGISKYESGGPPLQRKSATKCRVLVPGQVEDDRSVLYGGGPITTNLELLRRVRDCVGDAHIIYKPHPDVEAGHRGGAITDRIALEIADEVVRDAPISSLIDLVDEVHVNTSLAGFEALLRGKAVTTYGVPFFAGWGLTTDLGAVPGRRSARRSLDELVAAALLLYPRYLDPVTGLPCPPEVLVRRLSADGTQMPVGALVRLRRLQGRLKRMASIFWAR